jgi:hypothetical protein
MGPESANTMLIASEARLEGMHPAQRQQAEELLLAELRVQRERLKRLIELLTEDSQPEEDRKAAARASGWVTCRCKRCSGRCPATTRPH